MTTFLGVDLVDPQTPLALTHLVPAAYQHVSITYCNALPVDGHTFRGTRCCRLRDDVSPPEVEVFLPRVAAFSRGDAALAHARHWYALLHGTLVGVGYLAAETALPGIRHQENATDAAVRATVDAFADAWADARLAASLALSPTLWMPLRQRGYLGERVTRELRLLDRYISRASLDPEHYPCRNRALQRRSDLQWALSHGGQLAPGDALERLGLDRSNPSQVARLRYIARRDGIGIPFRDTRGRQRCHYRFGDVSLIAAAWNRPRRTRRNQTAPPAVDTTARP